MGTIKIINGVDYSNNAVGKIDFNTKVFRRKIDGKLERNIVYNNKGYLNNFDKVDLSSDVIKVKISFVCSKLSGSCRLFSVADYTTKRAFLSSHTASNNKLVFQGWFMIGANVYSYNFETDIDITNTIDVDVEFTIDFVNNKLSNILIDGVGYTIPTIAPTQNPNGWSYGQTRTICFGNVANYPDDSNSAGNGIEYFAQLSDSNDNVLLHFDFLGDNMSEILTDKARGIILAKSDKTIIESSPIDIN